MPDKTALHPNPNPSETEILQPELTKIAASERSHDGSITPDNAAQNPLDQSTIIPQCN